MHRFNSRLIGTPLAGAAMASVLVLGVGEAEERPQGADSGQGSSMGQQGPNGSGRGDGDVSGPGYGGGHQGYGSERGDPGYSMQLRSGQMQGSPPEYPSSPGQ